MPKERNAFKLGLTLIMFAVLLTGVLVFLAPTGGGDLTLSVRFPHDEFTTPVNPGGEVACGGKIVGSIESHELREMQDGQSGKKLLYSVVTITVDSSIGLRQDCRIIPEALLLGGVGKLTILDRGIGQPVEPDQMIDGEPVADFGSITRRLGGQLDPKDPTSLLAMVKSQLDGTEPRSLLGKILTALNDINAVTESIRHEFNPKEKAVLIAKLHSILDHINDTTQLLRNEADSSVDEAMVGKLHETLDTLNRGLIIVVGMLEDNREPITATVEHIRETSRILEQQIATQLAQQLDVSEPASLLAKVHVSIDRLAGALEDIRTITGVARETIVLNREQLARMIGNLKETSDHLKAAGKDIRRNPWRLLYQPTLDEQAQANVFDAARAFSEAATRLDDAITRLEAVAEAGGAGIEHDDPVLLTILDELEQKFAKFNEAEDALWEQLKIK